MKLLVISCDEAYREELMEGLCSVEGLSFEMVEGVKCRSCTSMRLGDSVWPGHDVLVLAVLDRWGEEELRAISSLKRSIEARAPRGYHPIRVLCLEAEEVP